MPNPGIGVVPGANSGYLEIDIPDTSLDENSVRVTSLSVGICLTDGVVASGNYGRPPHGRENIGTGHETVVRVGGIEGEAVRGLSVGQHYVVVVRRAAPGAPKWVSVAPHLCGDVAFIEEFGLVGLDGGFRQGDYLTDARSLIPVPDGLDVQFASLMEPASCISNLLRTTQGYRTVQLNGRDEYLPKRVVVLGGTGACGLLTTIFCLLDDFEVTVIGRSPEDSPRVNLVRSRGASYVRSVSNSSLLHLLKESFGGEPLLYFFDCVGDPTVAVEAELVLGPVQHGSFGFPEEAVTGHMCLSEMLIHRMVHSRGMAHAINADTWGGDWEEGARVLVEANDRWPGIFSKMVRVVDFSLKGIADSLRDRTTPKAIVLPNG